MLHASYLTSMDVTGYALDSNAGAWQQQVKFTLLRHLFTHLGCLGSLYGRSVLLFNLLKCCVRQFIWEERLPFDQKCVGSLGRIHVVFRCKECLPTKSIHISYNWISHAIHNEYMPVLSYTCVFKMCNNKIYQTSMRDAVFENIGRSEILRFKTIQKHHLNRYLCSIYWHYRWKS